MTKITPSLAALLGLLGAIAVPSEVFATSHTQTQTLAGGSNTRQIYDYDVWSGPLDMRTVTLYPDGVPGSKCVESIFDWQVGWGLAGHYDSRIVRVCDNVSTSQNSWSDAFLPPGHLYRGYNFPTNVQKAGGCKVTGANIYSLGGNRSGCVSSVGAASTAGKCGEGYAACLLRSGGAIYPVCFYSAQSSSC